MLGLQKLGFEDPHGKDRKRLVTFVEIDRCATDAVAVVTGCRLGKRALKFRDFGKAAATFCDLQVNRAVRIAARESSKERARSLYQELELDAAAADAQVQLAQLAAVEGDPLRSLQELDAIALESLTDWAAAWVRWAGRRNRLSEALITDSLEAVFNAISRFAQAYRDPAEFGLDYALVRRLLPDADLEALPRRAFAFPVLEGWHSGSDLSILDPADPNDRRALLAADHATPAPGGVGRHIERHMVLADRLWRGDPPELWEAAQRLLDAGQDRHLVLHALMAVLDHTSGDEAALIAVLRELEGDEP